MKREQALDILMLLSALESWGFSTKTDIPDYLHERLLASMEVLRELVVQSPNADGGGLAPERKRRVKAGEAEIAFEPFEDVSATIRRLGPTRRT